jgi:hypothetical protein
MKLRDLPDWPPAAGGSISPGDRFAVHADQVTIKNVQEVVKNRVTFSGIFGERVVIYNYMAPDEKLAAKVAAILKANAGKVLLSVGDANIADD